MRPLHGTSPAAALGRSSKRALLDRWASCSRPGNRRGCILLHPHSRRTRRRHSLQGEEGTPQRHGHRERDARVGRQPRSDLQGPGRQQGKSGLRHIDQLGHRRWHPRQARSVADGPRRLGSQGPGGHTEHSCEAGSGCKSESREGLRNRYHGESEHSHIGRDRVRQAYWFDAGTAVPWSRGSCRSSGLLDRKWGVPTRTGRPEWSGVPC